MWNKQPPRSGSLIVISGPSGSGKTSVIRGLCKADPRLVLSISATTRLPRKNETDGKNYHFLSVAEFKDLIQQDSFVEWAKYGEHYYGTLKSEVESPMAQGQDLVLEIDVQGAMQLKEQDFRSIFIFILPPSFAVLEKRLCARKTESDQELRQRLQAARSEVTVIKNYDYCVINPDDDIDQAVEQIRHIISAEKCRINNQLLESVVDEFSPVS